MEKELEQAGPLPDRLISPAGTLGESTNPTMNPGSHGPHTHDMSDEHDYRFDAESYDAAANGLSLYEDDFRSFREMHNDKPASWWDPGKVEVERRLSDLRRELDEMRHTAPDAWGENRDHFAKGMQELTQAYGQNIREIRRKG